MKRIFLRLGIPCGRGQALRLTTAGNFRFQGKYLSPSQRALITGVEDFAVLKTSCDRSRKECETLTLCFHCIHCKVNIKPRQVKTALYPLLKLEGFESLGLCFTLFIPYILLTLLTLHSWIKLVRVILQYPYGVSDLVTHVAWAWDNSALLLECHCQGSAKCVFLIQAWIWEMLSSLSWCCLQRSIAHRAGFTAELSCKSIQLCSKESSWMLTLWKCGL